jgi:anaerobic selenocysteine-containing dehydrogenase
MVADLADEARRRISGAALLVVMAMDAGSGHRLDDAVRHSDVILTLGGLPISTRPTSTSRASLRRAAGAYMFVIVRDRWKH